MGWIFGREQPRNRQPLASDHAAPGPRPRGRTAGARPARRGRSDAAAQGGEAPAAPEKPELDPRPPRNPRRPPARGARGGRGASSEPPAESLRGASRGAAEAARREFPARSHQVPAPHRARRAPRLVDGGPAAPGAGSRPARECGGRGHGARRERALPLARRPSPAEGHEVVRAGAPDEGRGATPRRLTTPLPGPSCRALENGRRPATRARAPPDDPRPARAKRAARGGAPSSRRSRTAIRAVPGERRARRHRQRRPPLDAGVVRLLTETLKEPAARTSATRRPWRLARHRLAGRRAAAFNPPRDREGAPSPSTAAEEYPLGYEDHDRN